MNIFLINDSKEDVLYRDNALAAILNSIAHELSHYFQWIKDFDYSKKKEERQAKYYSKKILQKYAEIREHP